jgi:O-antigen ligase
MSQISVAQLRTARRTYVIVVFAGGFALAAIGGLLIGVLIPQAKAVVLAAIVWMLLAMAFWRSPRIAVLVLAAGALLIEQSPTYLADRLTEQVQILQIFSSLNTMAGAIGLRALEGIYVTPAEILLVTALLAWLVKGVATRALHRSRSPLGTGLAILSVLLVAVMAHGLAVGGDLRIATDEIRPFLYVAILYFLASRTMARRSHVWALLWIDILATGFKGVQGTYRYYVLRDTYPPPEAILGHEEAFFFSLFILLTAGLWLFGIRGRLRRVASALLPFVFIADLANQRRTAWTITAAGLVLLVICAWVSCPERRRRILGFAVAVTVVSGIYLPAFWNSTGMAAEPARAIRSAFAPDARDDSSDLYRDVESLDLGIDIRQSTPLGYGFGRPIPHPVPLPFDAHSIDPLIDYIPHNGILYLWFRAGVAGALSFWFVIGAATVLACRLVRGADRHLALVGAFALWTLMAYVIAGWLDAGVTNYRTGVFVGCVLGTAEVARRLSSHADAATAGPVSGGRSSRSRSVGGAGCVPPPRGRQPA